MRFTRKLIIDFVLVFVMGALAGGLLTWKIIDASLSSNLSTFMSRTNDPDSMVARLNKRYVEDYHLTPDEMNRIQPVFNEMARNIYQVRHQFGVDIMATLDKYHQKIAEQLTPEHRKDYEKAIAEHKTKLASMLLDQSSPTEGSK